MWVGGVVELLGFVEKWMGDRGIRGFDGAIGKYINGMDGCGLHNAFLYEDLTRGPHSLSWGKSVFGHIQDVPSLLSADRETGVTYYLFISFGRVPFQFLFHGEYSPLTYGAEQQLGRNLDFDVMDRKKIKCKTMASCVMCVDKTLSLANY